MILKSSFLRQSGTIAIGTLVSHAILFAAMPLLTRLYSPADFGVLAFYLSLVGLIGIASCGGFESAIVLPESHDEAACVLGLSLLISAGVSFLTFVVVGALSYLSAFQLEAAELNVIIWLVPLGVLARGLYQALNFFAARHQLIKQISNSKIAQSVSTVSVQVSAHLYAPWGGFFALPLGHLFGVFAGIAILAWNNYHNIGRALKDVFRSRDTWRLCRKYRRFPLYNLPASWLNLGGYEFPPLILGAYFTAATVGEFSVAMRIIGAPVIILSASISPVFYQRATSAFREEGHCRAVTIPVMRLLFCFALPNFLCISIFAPTVFEWIFGAGWKQAGVFVSILSPLCFFTLLVSPISQIFYVYGRQKTLLMFQASFLVISIFSFLIAGMLNNVLLGIVLFSFLGSARYFVMVIVIARMDAISLKALLSGAILSLGQSSS